MVESPPSLPRLVGLIGRSHRRSAVGVLWVELDWLPQIFPHLENGCRTRKGKWEEIWGNIGFLATGNSDCPTSAKPTLAKSIHWRRFFAVEPLFLVQTYQGSVAANENRGVLNMNICVALISAKLSTEYFCFLRTQEPDSQSVEAYHLSMWTFAVFDSFLQPRLFRLNVNFCKSIDPSILRGLIFASTDMTSLGAILVIGKLEGLTREGGRGDLTFSCSEPKLFFRIMWPLRFSISDCRILLNFSTFCVSAQPHMEGFISVTHIDPLQCKCNALAKNNSNLSQILVPVIFLSF